jgi:hypothetical protein
MVIFNSFLYVYQSVSPNEFPARLEAFPFWIGWMENWNWTSR